MAEETKTAKEETKADEAKPASRKLLYLGIGGVFALLVLVGCALFLLTGEEEKKDLSQEETVLYVEDQDGVLTGALYKMRPFVINLGSVDSFLLMSIQIEFFDFVLPEDLQSRLPALRDAVIRVASDRPPKRLLSRASKDRLRVELINEMNKSLGKENPIIDLYFLDFTIQ